MRVQIAAPLQEVIAAYSAKPVGKVSTVWRPHTGGAKVAVVQSEEYAVVLQAWTNVTIFLEELESGTTTVDIKVHLGGGGLMKVSYGAHQKTYDRILKALSAFNPTIIDPK